MKLNLKTKILISVTSILALLKGTVTGIGNGLNRSSAPITAAVGPSKMVSDYLSQGLLYVGIAIVLFIIWWLLVYKV